MKNYLFLIMAGLFAGPFVVKASMPGDSIGTRIVDGKAFVLLRVTKGDNLGAISRQYNASVSYLQEINKLNSPSINIGQVLLVPSRSNGSGMSLGVSSPAKPAPETATAPVAAKPVPAQNPSPSTPVKHKVLSGESLFAVARKYSVSVEQIKKWNNLKVDGLNVGQVLIVSEPATKTASTQTPKDPEKQPEKAVAVNSPEGKSDTPQTEVKAVSDKPGVHIVKQGETLYGIARVYGMDARDLKVINKIEDPNLKVGQVLKVKRDPAANPNQGTDLIEMMATANPDTAKEKEAFPDLKVLTTSSTTMIAPEAKVTPYRDKVSGKNFKRIEEEGSAGLIEDYITDQTKFYAFHRYLPVGAYIRIDFPDKGQSILAEVTNQLPARDPHLVRLSAKCLDYLMIRQPGAKVRIRYVVPASN